MELLQMLANPRYQMIFEHPFDYLVKEVGGDELVYVCSREVVCEWLEVKGICQYTLRTYIPAIVRTTRSETMP